MNNSLSTAAALLVTGLSPASAAAWCEYRGELSAITTIDQEFADSRWVVRAVVVAGREIDTPDVYGTLYELEVVHA